LKSIGLGHFNPGNAAGEEKDGPKEGQPEGLALNPGLEDGQIGVLWGIMDGDGGALGVAIDNILGMGGIARTIVSEGDLGGAVGWPPRE
jgi:hypothetical protein